MDPAVPVRRVVRVRHETRRRELEVIAVERPSPGFVSVTLGDESLADFTSESFDDHIKVFLTSTSGEPVGRDYTPRKFDRAQRRLVIELAMHGDGAADRWAQQVAVGQKLTIGGPRGSMIVPVDYAWHLLVGDTSALPAILRRLEELPAGTPVTAIVQAGAADRREPVTQAKLDLRWVSDGDGMIEAVRSLKWPEGESYAWAAGEAPVMARMRQVLLQEKKHPKEAMRVAAYWKPGAAGHHENLEG